MLTKQQLKLFRIISESLKRDGVCPSFDEMKDEIGLRSKSGVHRLVKSLEERGFIRQIPNKARAIEVVRYPENFQGQNKRPAANDNTGVKTVPLYGKIAAGTPIAAIADTSETMDVPADMLGQGRFYALKVEGDSMIEAGIFDGDRVIIQEAHDVNDGEIAVALVDDEEVTLKYIYRKDGVVALKPANPTYETRIFAPERVKVQGRLAMLVRNY
ncbi:MAG: transcriptional repressor LexA [Rickettsiales bacterium]|jgi:repressor LexA|nr:transcriptional repressor LexA [Rickettsiales bacterium]